MRRLSTARYRAIRARLILHGRTLRELAERIGVNYWTLAARLRGDLLASPEFLGAVEEALEELAPVQHREGA